LILDSSAVIAVLSREQKSRNLENLMGEADLLSIGAPTLFETGMVAIGRFGPGGRERVDDFLEAWGVAIAPFDVRHWRVAMDAFARYGKGRSHPARLNYGDCMTYATARIAELPLLFTGEDFAKTDLAVA
jgi:ribonuclease VapC